MLGGGGDAIKKTILGLLEMLNHGEGVRNRERMHDVK